MLSALVRRVGVSLLVLVGLSVLAFAVVRVVPGDTADAVLGMRAGDVEARERVTRDLGLDRPLVVQYGLWVARVAGGDLGRTVRGVSVWEAVADAVPVTAQLAGMALLLAVVVGVPLGVVAAVRRDGPVDYAATSLAVLGISVPAFWLGTMMILIISIRLGWLPSGFYVSPFDNPVENMKRMAMPVLALGAAVAAVLARMTRASMLDVLNQDYIRTARAKGLSPLAVTLRHGLRNAMLPVLTILGIQTGYLIGGSIVIEEVFTLPGVGSLLLDAVRARDYPLLQSMILLIGGAFVLINLTVDLIYLIVDPRMRME